MQPEDKIIRFADPFLVCADCYQRVIGFRWGNNLNYPCGHHTSIMHTCPSWGPVDGCTCNEPASDHYTPGVQDD